MPMACLSELRSTVLQLRYQDSSVLFITTPRRSVMRDRERAAYSVRTLCSLTKRIEQMEAAKDNHLSQIAALDMSLERARAEHKRITNQLAPISWLPNELLSAI